MSIYFFTEGVKGECSDANHRDWVDVDSISTGSARLITSQTSTRGDRESSNTITRNLKFTKTMDKASPSLFIHACCMRGKDMIFHITKTGQGDGADVYMEYVLRHALISDYHVLANNNSPLRPKELITVSYTDIDVKYTPYDEDGIEQGNIAVGFNTATNTRK